MQVIQNNNDVIALLSTARTYQAQVYAIEADRYGVVSTLGCFWFPLALSCLVVPEIEDTVLVSQSGQEGYVLAVLKRSHVEQSVVRLPAYTQLQAEGSLTIQSDQNIHIRAKQTLTMNADQGLVQTTQLQIQSKQLRQQVTDRYTQISGHDELRINSQRLVVEKDWRVRAKTADIRAERHLVIDSEKIHLG